MGTSGKGKNAYKCYEDHPHAYGDKDTYGYNPDRHIGSSPRVWGQAMYNDMLATGKRIIPTRMGTRFCTEKVRVEERDHPHAYGDKHSNFYQRHISAGSSPRVWGQGGLR